MKPEMTPRERILAAMRHQPVDRVPLDYWGVEEITGKLMRHFGVSDLFSLSAALGIDMIMNIDAPLKPEVTRKGIWNVEYKRIPLHDGSGWYDEPVSHPLADYETIDEIEANYTWPNADMFDYSGIKAECVKSHERGYAISVGYISISLFYEEIRGIEQMLMDFAGNPELAEYILFKCNEFAAAYVKRQLEAADGLADITQVTDDFGMQNGLIMSREMIDRYFGKYYEQNIAAAKARNAIVFHHDDGAITDIIPWVAEKGCEVLNPLQWHLPGWDLHELKRRYAKKLCFHGGIDNQYVLPFGTADEVKAEVRACIDALFTDRTGFILAPCHNLQAITPIENIITMYEYAREYSST